MFGKTDVWGQLRTKTNYRVLRRETIHSVILTCKLLGFTEVFKQENGNVDFSWTIALMAKAEKK